MKKRNPLLRFMLMPAAVIALNIAAEPSGQPSPGEQPFALTTQNVLRLAATDSDSTDDANTSIDTSSDDPMGDHAEHDASLHDAGEHHSGGDLDGHEHHDSMEHADRAERDEHPSVAEHEFEHGPEHDGGLRDDR